MILNKIILVWYVDVSNMSSEDVQMFLKKFAETIEIDMNNEKYYNIYIPRRNYPTKLEVIDSSTIPFSSNHSFEKFVNSQQDIINNLQDENLKDSQKQGKEYCELMNEYRWFKNQSIFKIILGRIKTFLKNI